MHRATSLATLLVLQCSVCLTIKVPVAWSNGASVLQEQALQQQTQDEFSVEEFKPENVQQKQLPQEYFQYTAKKPQFAVDIAQFHGVPNPQNQYKAHPIRPHTARDKPPLGIHHMLDADKAVYQQYQQFINKEEQQNKHVTPISSNYEVFHPYKAEEPALINIYKDPVLSKIRSDIHDSKNRFEKYEKDAGEPDITKSEYLESPELTEHKLFPQKNVPAHYEIHKPQRRPVYYKPLPRYNNREQVLNQRFKHPLNQNYVQIRPEHYRPLKNHLHHLRQHHAMKYDDEQNEYPQLSPPENNAEPPDGYDIYENGRNKYIKLRNNVDESINKAVIENRPVTNKHLELQKDEPEDEDDEDSEFVPIKNYAQVRKTETVKHLPREAAYEDAETLDEILNAPRLREAVKSEKAQTVYSEEGYEDSAYDHAGEQKHASDHEGHGGYLKEKEISGGKYKIPSLSASYQDGKGSKYQDKVVHGKKWEDDNKDEVAEEEKNDYSENEHNNESYQDEQESNRNKREHDFIDNVDKKTSTEESDSENNENPEHGIDKREINFEVPEIDINSTLLSEEEILSIAKQTKELKKDDINIKYPYYFSKLNAINEHSPLRYAKNFKFIPKKSKGGTEFYDSRTTLVCPEVENIDPLPEKLKNGQNPTSEENGDVKSDSAEEENAEREQPRLRHLGDKIDCFKAKYFGENPLDSPFFQEEIIANPEPITLPDSSIYKLKDKGPFNILSQNNTSITTTDTLRKESNADIFILLDKLRNDQNSLQQSLVKNNNALIQSLLHHPLNITPDNNKHFNVQSNVYSDIIQNIQQTPLDDSNNKKPDSLLNSTPMPLANNVTYNFYQNKEDVTKSPLILRKKRATPFIYEPYKIIRDGQVQDSKKTTTSSNVSPLIKQLQSSRVVDKVAKKGLEQDPSDKNAKMKVSIPAYKDIGRKDREKGRENITEDQDFVDVNTDHRRGEPRYELRTANHKPEYTPVENKKSMSLDDYKAHSKNESNESSTKENTEATSIRLQSQTLRHISPSKLTFDVSKFIPTTTEVQLAAASNTVKTVASSTPNQNVKPTNESTEDDEEYEEYEDEEDDELPTTTTSTTSKPTFRRRIRPTTTTEKPEKESITESEVPKLRLVTRFRDYNLNPTEKSTNLPQVKLELGTITTPHSVNYEEEEVPKYREKKKKSSSSTIVTDTKKYGNDDDDNMKKDEIDALIGVKEEMDDYRPSYEKEENRRKENRYQLSELSDEDDDNDDDGYEGEGDDSDDDEENDEEDDDEEDESELEREVTTPEPMKRTLVKTTEAPAPTTEAYLAKLEAKPVVSKKTIEIHKELPVNNSSPHRTQFKQDIKEIEIVKELPAPKKKPQKHVEAFELYKDDKLAKDVNKLSDVEVFKEDLDLENGPKHGGNYRRATMEELAELTSTSPPTRLQNGSVKIPKDAETSQTENKKQIELDRYAPKRMHGGNLRSFTDLQRAGYRGRNSKLIELKDLSASTRPEGMHGGNLKPLQDSSRRRGNNRNEKLIEFSDEHNNDDDDSPSQSHSNNRGGSSYGTSRNERPLHGGNYRSAKLVKADDKETTINDDIKVKSSASSSRDARRNAAVLLNSFAQAAPILTTTPAYILDPSKRMYYYVD